MDLNNDNISKDHENEDEDVDNIEDIDMHPHNERQSISQQLLNVNAGKQ